MSDKHNDTPSNQDGNSSLATKELISKLDTIMREMETQKRERSMQADERHELNGRVHRAMMAVSSATLDQDRRTQAIEGTLTNLSTEVRGISTAVSRIERCLAGDPELATEGLIQKQREIERRLEANEKLTHQVQEQCSTIRIEMNGHVESARKAWKVLSIAGGILVTLILLAKQILTWIKGSP